jgi:hypothetical protein
VNGQTFSSQASCLRLVSDTQVGAIQCAVIDQHHRFQGSRSEPPFRAARRRLQRLPESTRQYTVQPGRKRLRSRRGGRHSPRQRMGTRSKLRRYVVGFRRSYRFSTHYNGAGDKQSLVVTIPKSNSDDPTFPNGAISNGSTTDFLLAPNKPAAFLFRDSRGSIAGWNATVAVSPGANPPSTNAMLPRLPAANSGLNRPESCSFEGESPHSGKPLMDGGCGQP